jgi:hypothetical protein
MGEGSLLTVFSRGHTFGRKRPDFSVSRIQLLKRSALAFEMVLSGLITEYGERADAAEGVSLSHTPYA